MYRLSSEFDRLRREFNEALIACRAATEKKQVHSLRTGTRRLEALLKKAAEDHPGSKPLQVQANKVLRRLKRVRKAAGVARDLDVLRNLAGPVRDRALTSTKPSEHENLIASYKQLEDDLRSRRKHAASELATALEEHEPGLERALEAMSKAMSNFTAKEPSPMRTANIWMKRIRMPGSDPGKEALHSFRKQTKTMRYLAELEPRSITAQRFAAHLKAIQGSIGQWHDLLLFVEEAKEILGKDSLLTQVVKTERNQARRAAMRSIR
ncbi:Adenylate cyclase [Acidisarcina polymorpha]|uniref:Adenylate cyclase n=1 Tax=Acidisarcina polymorpha TaxID=2211140 RepID=A0A2Z5G6H4_9BACT|nr:CHAD domain-containing protein [Acidisarcina polymorpha]AXC14235.1 Adenylate cyclase [Acidisarcina polymorpha]